MIQKFAFTTAAMAAALEDTSIEYEDLAEIERDFDDAETEIIRQQVELTNPLYERRHKVVSQIPNFWPLVLEQAPPDIDQYIQPSDSAVLLSSLTSLWVSHFEIDNSSNPSEGDPRSVSIRWEFAGNEYFEDRVLEKKFWYRRAKDGWTGLVSEPVDIRWKEGKDLTYGLLDMVYKAWVVEQNQANGPAKSKAGGLTDEQKVLKKKIDSTGMGGLSFFAWFGFIGRRVSAVESDEARRREAKRRMLRKQGKKVQSPLADAEDDEDEDVDMSLEIFPDGDDLAIAITEDLWPGALKFFTQAQEQDALSDADFESDDENDADDPADAASASASDAGSDSPPTKKRRS